MSNYIDTRDLYKRKCELEDLRDTLNDAKQELAEAEQALANITPEADGEEIENAIQDARDNMERAEQDFSTDEEAELAELENLESEISEFMHGETMIPESQFEDYARELAEECCDMKHADKWPYTCIDWEQAAKELAMDYSTVTYQGTDYYVRS